MMGGGWRHREVEESCGFVNESFGPAHALRGRVDSPWTTRQTRVAHRLPTLAGLSPTTPQDRQRVFLQVTCTTGTHEFDPARPIGSITQVTLDQRRLSPNHPVIAQMASDFDKPPHKSCLTLTFSLDSGRGDRIPLWRLHLLQELEQRQGGPRAVLRLGTTGIRCGWDCCVLRPPQLDAERLLLRRLKRQPGRQSRDCHPSRPVATSLR